MSTSHDLVKHDDNLIWIDLEMTGLDPERDRIIEVAVIVTDPHLRLRVPGPVHVIHQSDATLAGMDEWNTKQHAKTGLTERVRQSTTTEAQAAADVIAFLQQHVAKGKSPMCGNSICQDRRFLAKHMPELEAFFHYRNLDVSTLKELARRWKPAALEGFEKRRAHTALSDVEESIDELVHYRNTFLRG